MDQGVNVGRFISCMLVNDGPGHYVSVEAKSLMSRDSDVELVEELPRRLFRTVDRCRAVLERKWTQNDTRSIAPAV